jgi:hypothetical protein
LLIFVIRGVVHIWYIEEFHLKGGKGRAHVPAQRVVRPSYGAWRRTFGLPVALVNLDAKGNLEEVKHLLCNRRRPSNHDSDSATENFLELFEH